MVFCARGVSSAAFLDYVFQLNGAAAKEEIWSDIRISLGVKETLVCIPLIRQEKIT